MILTALKELAEREGLVKNPDFEPGEVAYLVTIGPGGVLQGNPIRTEGASASRRGKPRPQVFDIPKRSERTAQNLAEFLVDKAEYVFGWGDAKRARQRNKLFLDEVRKAFEDTSDEALGDLLRSLELVGIGEITIQRPENWADGDLFGFIYSADQEGPRLISSRPAVAEYWARRRTGKGPRASGTER